MEFLIADTFSDSLARLTGQEQKAVKTTAFDLQLNPTSPGLRFHKFDRAKDPNFWSVRVSADIRLIVHKTASSLMLCYVDHHDAAYAWAARRKIERHPKTGAAQLVEIRERVEDIVVPRAAPAAPIAAAKPALFAELPDHTLLAYGVPPEWLGDVRKATEDTILDVADHLPQEAAEALLTIATGGQPQSAPAAFPMASVPERGAMKYSPGRGPVALPMTGVPERAAELGRAVAAESGLPSALPLLPEVDAFAHPDAQRRFRVVANVKELERALEFPWEKWAVFLHPAQRQLVEWDYNGPARVSGSAGTGKTIVAIHRAAFLARRNPAARVLLTTFSTALANALKTKFRHLTGNEPEVASRIRVLPITGVGYELYTAAFGQPNIVSPTLIRSLLQEASANSGGARFTPRFLLGEWTDVVDAWQLKTWESYRDIARLGRKTRVGGKQREVLWSIFERVRAGLTERKTVTWSDVFGRVTEQLAAGGARPFDFAVVDEAQDIGVAECRFLATLAGARPNGLFFAGDLGQRIFQQPFSWKSLGVDIRGRSYTLRINYRTSHQIRSQADRLLPALLADVDGNAESRRGTVSVFNGPLPAVEVFDDESQEAKAVGKWTAARLKEGVQPHEIGVFVRSNRELKRARTALKAASVPFVELSDKIEITPGRVSISTMHLAKGLEFRAVAVMACDDEILPLQERIESVADDADLEEVYNTERHLLYVACTRARDHLLVTGVKQTSEFLGDFVERRLTGPGA